MYALQQSHPLVFQDIQNGAFAVSTISVPFASIGTNQTLEYVNKINKEDGVISGLTTSPKGLLMY